MKSRSSTTRLRDTRKEVACPQCGDFGITTSRHRQTFAYGSGDSVVELAADVPVRCCGACEFQYLDEEAERIRHEAVCKHLGVLSPAEIRRIRASHQMTRTKFAGITGLGEASLNRWENGLTVQTRANDRYIRLLARPAIMQLLKNLVDARELPRPVLRTGGNRFQMLEVTDAMCKKQGDFQLRRVA